MDDGRLLKLGAFAAARAAELSAVEARGRREGWWAAPEGRALRRRTRSHQSRKIPRKRKRLAAKEGSTATSEAAGSGTAREDTSREMRRRRRRLVEAHGAAWTISHLWAAKRMKMGELTPEPDAGARPVALRPAGQGPRFMQTQAVQGCTVLDMSFLDIFEVPVADLVGPEPAPLGKPQQRLGVRDGAAVVPAWCLATGATAHLFVDPRAGADLDLLAPPQQRTLRSDAFAVLRLRGPRTHHVLRKALQTAAAPLALRSPAVLPRGAALAVAIPAPTAPVAAPPVGGAGRVEGASRLPLEEQEARLREAVEASQQRVAMPRGETVLLVRNVHEGWDLVVEREHGMRVWLRLVHAGAVAAGVADEELAAAAAGERQFPLEYPAARAFAAAWEAREEAVREQRARQPKGKRAPMQWLGRPMVDVPPAWVDLKLLGQQPKGARARLETGAAIEALSAAETAAWKATPREWPGLVAQRPVVGMVAVAAEGRLKPATRTRSAGGLMPSAPSAPKLVAIRNRDGTRALAWASAPRGAWAR